MAQRTQQAQQLASAIEEAQQQVASLEELAAGRQAEAQRLALQLSAAEEALAAAKEQVGEAGQRGIDVRPPIPGHCEQLMHLYVQHTLVFA